MSKNRRGGLGRGIGALIPSAPPPEAVKAAEAVKATEATTDSVEAETVAQVGSPSSAASSAGLPDANASISASVEHDGEKASEGSEGLLPVPGVELRDVPIALIRPNARQPRTVFDDEALSELTHSVREFGVLQPVVVRPISGLDANDSDGDFGYELVMGERRLRAATAAGLQTIPAVVRNTADDAMLRDALLENIHRVQLNPLEEAAAYQQLLEEFGVTHEQLAVRIGRSRSQVSNTVRLMNLSVPVQRRVAAGVLSAGHARALLALEDSDAQDDLAARIVAEGLSVRATEELVSVAAAGPAKRRRVARTFTAPAATDLAEKLSDVFETRVKVDIGRHKGKIVVEFGSIADLERIIDVMVPGLNPRRPSPEA